MSDPAPPRRPAVSAENVAARVGGELFGSDEAILGVCTLDRPRPGFLAFAKTIKPDEIETLAQRTAGVILIVPREMGGAFPGSHIAVDAPRRAFAVALDAFFATKPVPGVAPTARIAPDAILGENVTIGEYVVVGPGCQIGNNTEIRHHVTIGPRVRIGSHCLIRSNSVIGEEGFGIDTDEFGNNIRIPHIGSVIIGDHVEVGALCTVCSGTVNPTILGDYVKTDDHVHIAHNVAIGRNTILTACAELSGSMTIGEGVWIGPNSSFMHGISIGDRAFIGLGAVVTKDCQPNGLYTGAPARLVKERPEGL